MEKKENKDRRKLKNEPKLKLDLNEEQREAKARFYEYDVNFFIGDFASGKTLLATAVATTAFRKKQFNKIVITRPVVKNNLGFLPGELEDKMKPWVSPIIHNFNQLQNNSITEKMLEEGDIEILPIDFAKGITYVNSVVIVDEFQDLNYSDFRTMLTRLGRDSKIIFVGSAEQIDRSIGNKSCIYQIRGIENSNLVGYSHLKSNHRNPVLTDIIKFLEEK